MHHEPSIGDLLYPAINFAIFVVLMVKYLSGPIREFFRARTQRLRESLDAGAAAQREAEALRAQIEQDTRNLPAMKAQIQKDLRDTANQQRQRLLDQAQSAADRIRRDAETMAVQEVAAAQHALRQELAERVVVRASALLGGALKDEDQQRLVRDFVSSAQKVAA